MGQKNLAEIISMRGVILPDDEPFLMRLFFELHLEDPNWKTLEEKQRKLLLDMQYSAQNQHYSNLYPNAAHQIVNYSGTSVGRLFVDRSAKYIHCIDITILGEYRNQGIGSFILNDLIGESSKSEKVFSLEVLKTNPAVKLYERLGLKVVRDEGAHWRMELLE
ncbi:MAG: GNAT family N-acetyltransferase [Pyrinomonadaceae bacterium]|nr:GNAT family N-acetyltransferase [Pyrinomonadaceae bacterium]